MLLDTRNRAALPDEDSAGINAVLPGHSRSAFGGLEVQEALLARPDATAILKKSSMG
jgi:hypothetical protein